MGANAQTTVPSFTIGQVLTADQMNQSARTGVPVFADTTARDAAFGGTGEKALAEGQLCYLENLNVVQYYDGSSWATVGPSNPSGLVTIKNETAFSAASQVICDDVFTSSYTFYKLALRLTATTADLFSLRLRVGGSAAATNYNFQLLSGGATTASAARFSSQTSYRLGLGGNGAFFESIDATISGPALAATTTFIVNSQTVDGADTSPLVQFTFGNHTTATAYDGFEINTGGGTITGVYSVYGLAKTGA